MAVRVHIWEGQLELVKGCTGWYSGDTRFLANERPGMPIGSSSRTYEMLEVLEFCSGSV
jgi:hypothetical protein